MELPESLWTDDEDRRLARLTADAWQPFPIILTDRLANSVYLNAPAEAVLAAPAEALLNRAAVSLLGFHDCASPAGLHEALLGEGPPWRGAAVLDGRAPGSRFFVEASAVVRASSFVCGIIRIGKPLA